MIVGDMMTEDYLQHYGVQGMKWGVRRYRNKDGSLKTNKNSKRQVKNLKKAIWDPKGDYTNRNKVFSKHAKELSNSKEAKAYNDLLKKRGIKLSNGQVKLSYLKDDWSNPDKVMKQIVKDKKIEDNYRKKDAELIYKYNSDVLGAALKDIGFKDTLEGRKWLAKNKILGYL